MSHRRAPSLTLEADSPRPPVSSEKGPSERYATPRIGVAIFGGKNKTGKPIAHVSAGKVPSYSGDFAATNVAESTSSISGIKTLTPEHRPDLCDYLPSSEIPRFTVENPAVANSDSDATGSSMFSPANSSLQNHGSRETEDESSACNQPSSTTNEERRRGSRGILADIRDRFGKVKAVEDVSIQVIFAHVTPT